MTTEQTAGTDLHTRIREALQERIRLAKACPSQVWSADPTQTDVCAVEDIGPDGTLAPIGQGPQEVAECYRNTAPGERQANAAHIAANDPASTIRLAESRLRTLDRHAPKVVRYVGGLRNVECACGETDPCVEVRELAAGEGLET